MTGRPRAAALLAPRFAGAPGEKLALLHLDAGRRLIALAERPAGPESEPSLTLPIRWILASALALETAGLVVAHNHPSGVARPSRADVEATRRLADAAAALGIALHDHLVFAGGGYVSLREQGLL